MIKNLFPTPIWYTKLNLPEEIRADLLMQIENNYQDNKDYLHPDWACMIHSTHVGSVNDSINNVDFKELFPYLHKEYSKYSKEIGICGHDYGIHECWYNYYVKGSNQESHHHLNLTGADYPQSLFSGVYFLKLRPEDPKIQFVNENGFRYCTQTSHNYSRIYGQLDCMKTYAEYGEEDYVLLFPAFTQHRVTTQKTDGPRITISFNFNLEKIC